MILYKKSIFFYQSPFNLPTINSLSIFYHSFLLLKNSLFLILGILTQISHNNMHVYNISPIFVIDDTKLSVEFKSNILLLWPIISYISSNFVIDIHIYKNVFFVPLTINKRKKKLTLIFQHYLFPTMLCPWHISYVYQI